MTGKSEPEQPCHDGIIPDIGRPVHREDDAIVGDQLLERFTGTPAAEIRVIQQVARDDRAFALILGHSRTIRWALLLDPFASMASGGRVGTELVC